MSHEFEIPQFITLECSSFDLATPVIEAAAEDESDGKKKLPTFSMQAYSGGFMRLLAWPYPVVANVAGIRASDKTPILIEHGYSGSSIARSAFGHTTKVSTKGGKMTAEGIVSGVGEEVEHCLAMAANGFPFQASQKVEIDRGAVQFIPDGETVKANGRSFTGPCYYAASGQLREISLVVLGADPETETTIAARAAKETPTMPQKHEPTAANPATPANTAQPAAITATATPAPEASPSESNPDIVGRINRDIAANYERIGRIQAVTTGNADLCAQAIRENWTPEKAELEVLRASRAPASSPSIIAGKMSVGFDAPVIEAALCIAARMHVDKVAKQYGDETVEAAQKRFRSGGVSLQEIIIEAARANGRHDVQRITPGNCYQVLQAAFSSHTLSATLSNVANKTAETSFMEVDQSWREIAAIKNANDFKQMTGVRLVAGMKYQPVAQDGELKHATVGEATYNNQVNTHGILFTLTRKDIVNDDLGLLNDYMAQLGRGGAIAVNDHFWSVWLDDAAFFNTDGSKNNYISGATTVLSIAGLDQAFAKFMKQKDESAAFIGVIPTAVVVPVALHATAQALYVSTHTNGPSSSKEPTANTWMGRLKPIVVPYLDAASATAWYLVGRSGTVAPIEMAFLNGRELPTIESVELAPDVLGFGVRGYHDFGAARKEYRVAVKSKGAA